MYQNSIPQLPRLSPEKYENIFNVYVDNDSRYYYNLLQAVNFPTNLPNGVFKIYTVSPGDTLPYISYKLFSTIHLWWIICLTNNIDNPTVNLEPGTTLKILNDSIIKLIVKEINS